MDAAAAVIATAVGTGVGGLGGAIFGAGLSPYLAAGIRKVLDEWNPVRWRSAGRVLEEAQAARPDVSLDELLGAAGSSPEKQLLAGAAVTAGSLTVLPEKLRALGRSLASGVLAHDDALVDEELLIVRALADMEAPHVRVLDLMIKCHYNWEEPLNPTTRTDDRLSGYWSVRQLGTAVPTLRGLAAAVVQTLAVHGLVRARDKMPQVFQQLASDLEHGGRDRYGLPTDVGRRAGTRDVVSRAIKDVTDKIDRIDTYHEVTPLGVALHSRLLEEGDAATWRLEG